MRLLPSLKSSQPDLYVGETDPWGSAQKCILLAFIFACKAEATAPGKIETGRTQLAL